MVHDSRASRLRHLRAPGPVLFPGSAEMPRGLAHVLRLLAIASSVAMGCSGSGATSRSTADAGAREDAGSGTGSASSAGSDAGKLSGQGGPCSVDSDCYFDGSPPALLCWSGQSIGSGYLQCAYFNTTNCQQDSDCSDAGPGEVCQPTTLACSGTQCGPKCTSASDCLATSPPGGLACLTTGHCGPIACSRSGDCPVNYTCDADRCVVKSCTSDSECSVACVDGLCAAQAGVCMGEYS